MKNQKPIIYLKRIMNNLYAFVSVHGWYYNLNVMRIMCKLGSYMNQLVFLLAPWTILGSTCSWQIKSKEIQKEEKKQRRKNLFTWTMLLHQQDENFVHFVAWPRSTVAWQFCREHYWAAKLQKCVQSAKKEQREIKTTC